MLTASPAADFGVNMRIVTSFAKSAAALGATSNSAALLLYVFCRLAAYLALPIFSSASASLPDHFEKSKLADLNARLPMSPLGSMAKVGICPAMQLLPQ